MMRACSGLSDALTEVRLLRCGWTGSYSMYLLGLLDNMNSSQVIVGPMSDGILG